MRKINLKSGNGASLIGLTLIVLAFAISLMLSDYFNWFNAAVITQTRTDAIADAMAVAANDGSGAPDVFSMRTTRTKMLTRTYGPYYASTTLSVQNNPYKITDTHLYDVSFDEEALYGTDGTTKTLKLSTKARTPYLNSRFLKADDSDDSFDYIYTKGYNETRIMVSKSSERNRKFPVDITKAVDPDLVFTDSSYPMDIDKLRSLITQFEVELSDRYKPVGTSTRQNVFLWDVTRTLGCEIPYFFRRSDGAPWDVESDGVLRPDGSFINELGTIDGYGGATFFAKDYMSNVSPYYVGPHGEMSCSPDQYPAYANWKVIGKNSSATSDLDRIQSMADAGYPTVVLFDNGQTWIVLPSIDRKQIDRGLYVSYATDLPEDSMGAYSGTATANSTNAGYRVPWSSYVAIYCENPY